MNRRITPTTSPPGALPGRALAGVRVACLLAGLLNAGTVLGQTPAETDAAVTPAPPVEALESTRRWARSSSQWLARSVDSWFGDTPFEAGGKVSDGQLTLGVFRRQDQTPEHDLRFNARFRLPNVERRAYVFIGRDDPRSVIQDTPDAVRQQQLLPDRPLDRALLAGLGVLLLQKVDFRVGIGAGLKPYAQARYDHPWVIAANQRINLRETLYWSDTDRFGSTTSLSYDLALSDDVSMLWLSTATFNQTSRNLAWSSTLTAVHSLGPQRRVSLQALTSGTGTSGTGVGSSDYGMLVRWEQPAYRDWLLLELVGGHFWPRPDADSARGRAWAAGACLKMQF